MFGTGIAEGVAGEAIWSGAIGALRRVSGRQIQITFPRSGQALIHPEPLGPIRSFEVRGKLKRLPKNHEIWLLREHEVTRKVWPQGFPSGLVRYDPGQGEWSGRVAVQNDQRAIKIVAVVAPPTSQDFFRYFQRLGDQHQNHVPLDRIPDECTNRFSVQALIGQ